MAQARRETPTSVTSTELVSELSTTHVVTERPTDDPDATVVAVQTSVGEYAVRISVREGATSYFPVIGKDGERGFRPAARFDASRETVADLAQKVRDRAVALEEWAARREERIVEVARVASDLGLELRDGDPVRLHEGPARNLTVYHKELWLVTFNGLTEAQARALLAEYARLRG